MQKRETYALNNRRSDISLPIMRMVTLAGIFLLSKNCRFNSIIFFQAIGVKQANGLNDYET